MVAGDGTVSVTEGRTVVTWAIPIREAVAVLELALDCSGSVTLAVIRIPPRVGTDFLGGEYWTLMELVNGTSSTSATLAMRCSSGSPGRCLSRESFLSRVDVNVDEEGVFLNLAGPTPTCDDGCGFEGNPTREGAVPTPIVLMLPLELTLTRAPTPSSLMARVGDSNRELEPTGLAPPTMLPLVTRTRTLLVDETRAEGEGFVGRGVGPPMLLPDTRAVKVLDVRLPTTFPLATRGRGGLPMVLLPLGTCAVLPRTLPLMTLGLTGVPISLLLALLTLAPTDVSIKPLPLTLGADAPPTETRGIRLPAPISVLGYFLTSAPGAVLVDFSFPSPSGMILTFFVTGIDNLLSPAAVATAAILGVLAAFEPDEDKGAVGSAETRNPVSTKDLVIPFGLKRDDVADMTEPES